MKITIQNLGVLRQADFEVGDLTVICGKNNTGKTYATYALYGFLKIWKHLIHIGIGSSEIEELIEQNAISSECNSLKRYIEYWEFMTSGQFAHILSIKEDYIIDEQKAN